MQFILFFLLLITFKPALAEDETQYELLDRTKDLLSGNLDYLANRVDSFFATDRADDEFGRSTLRIRTNYEIREFEKGDTDIGYRLNFKIPSLDKKIKQGTDKLFKKKKKSNDEDNSLTVPTRSREDWYFNADLGVNASIPPKAVVRARLRKNILLKTWSHRFSEQVTFVTEEDGVTEETSFTSDYPVKENILLRILNIKRWKVLSKQLSTDHGPQLIHQLTEKDALNYSLIAQSIIAEEGPWILNNYRLSVRYRRDLYQQWIYFDQVVGLDFPKTYSFRRNPFVIFQLEVLFGS